MRVVATALALAGAVLLPISLTLDWYEVETGDSLFQVDGWQVFETTDTVMVLASIATLALLVTWPAYIARALMVVGAFVTGFIAVQLIDRPGILGFADDSALSIEAGAWLGLGSALLIVGAGAAATRTRP